MSTLVSHRARALLNVNALCRVGLRSGVSIWLACATVCAEPLRFAGVSLDTPLATLSARFPRARHQFMDSDGRIRERSDGVTEFDDLLARGSGHYDLSLSSAEGLSPVMSIRFDITDGITRRIRLSFEKPDDGSDSSLGRFERRHPACAPILADLTKRYGKPRGPETTAEERLQDRAYAWAAPSEELVLHCGHYVDRRAVFAMEVVLRRPSRD